MAVEIKNAVITSVRLSTADYGCLSAWVNLDYGGSGQGFGGFVLYLPSGNSHHTLKSIAGHFIFRVMEVAGVEEWSKAVGKAVRVKAEAFGNIEAIGHIVKDDWFNPKADFEGVEK